MAENADRPNGKKWKKIWGPSGPPEFVVEGAKRQSTLSKRKKKESKNG
jgi:hypothetical protein